MTMTTAAGCVILSVLPLRRQYVDEACVRLDALTKPRGSLGRLEELVKRLFAMRCGKTPLTVTPALLFTVAADHAWPLRGFPLGRRV
jgi:nicotinate-nucleotide--dimethylbenzimidazole phosphoribosyltransferase